MIFTSKYYLCIICYIQIMITILGYKKMMIYFFNIISIIFVTRNFDHYSIPMYLYSIHLILNIKLYNKIIIKFIYFIFSIFYIIHRYNVFVLQQIKYSKFNTYVLYYLQIINLPTILYIKGWSDTIVEMMMDYKI